jgi:uncharacterized integral membrane protein
MREQTKKILLIVIVIFTISGAISLIGTLAKLQHWPIAGLLLNIGIIGCTICYLLGGFAIFQYIKDK